MERQATYTNSVMARMQALMVADLEYRLDGCRLIGQSGREYLNMAGYGVLLLGSTPSEILEPVVHQMRAMAMSSRVMAHPALGEAAQALLASQEGHFQKVVFTNSGAEATEVAIKLARANGCERLVSTEGGFHGKTTGALSLIGTDLYRDPFRPLLASDRVPYGDLAALEEVLDRPGKSCVFVEPVQGEAGVVFPPEGYLSAVCELAHHHGALVVVDEIQTGLGRLGEWWEFLRESCHPDAVLSGKVLSGGLYPVAAVSATEGVYAPLDADPVLHSSTYGGSPAAATTVTHVLRYLRDHDVPGQSASLGQRLRPVFERLGGDPSVVEVRGRGLLWGVEFAEGGDAGAFLLHCIDHGVLPSTTLNSARVVRFTPTVGMEGQDIDVLASCVEAWLSRVGDEGHA